MKDKSDGLTILKTYPSAIHADIDKALLATHKIWAMVQKGPARPDLLVTLFVRNRDLQEAAELLKEPGDSRDTKSSMMSSGDFGQQASREKMFCTNCGREITEGVSLCEACGQSIGQNNDTKPLLKIIGIIVVLLIPVGIVGFSLLASFGAGLDKESKAYVDEIIPQIVTSWDADALLKNASPELIELINASPEKEESLFSLLAERLGPMREYKEPRGEGGITIRNLKRTTTGYYDIEAEFEKGSATIRVTLIKLDNNWRLASFVVRPDVLEQ